MAQRSTNLSANIEPHTPERVHRYKIDDINLSPSPIHTHAQPRLFRPGMLLDAETFQRIQATVNHPPIIPPMIDDDDDDDDEGEEEVEKQNDGQDENQEGLRDILYQGRAEEIEYLSQLIQYDRPTTDVNEISNILFELIGNIPESTVDNNREKTLKITTADVYSSYPPINQTGTVAERDRPYADYGHLDRATLAHELQFNLQRPSSMNQPPLRLQTRSFAITSWTNISKETVMDAIKNEFRIEQIQYICIGEEISELNHQRHLHIQIILKERINKKKRFLDEITETHCNYQVTHNDRAWNEYIRKDGNYIEFGDFHSVSARGQKQWPSTTSASTVSSSSAAASSSLLHPVQLTRARTTTNTTTARVNVEERRQLAKQALDLAETTIDGAMDLIRHSMPEKFLSHSTWFLSTFKYIRLRAQHKADQRGEIDKEYVWPLSFPDCTPQLREAINRWIRHHFGRKKRAKCLILIGPTGTGKTSFALSLPGRVNYFKERWNLDKWNDYARYSVYDDIPWDEFKNLNYPNKKASDKYRGTVEINVQQPAIVLLNPEDTGELTAEPTTMTEQKRAAYWKKRAFIYIMGPNEYFYRRPRTTTNASHGDQSQGSSTSSMHSNEARVGEIDEFDKMIQHYQQKHPQ